MTHAPIHQVRETKSAGMLSAAQGQWRDKRNLVLLMPIAPVDEKETVSHTLLSSGQERTMENSTKLSQTPYHST